MLEEWYKNLTCEEAVGGLEDEMRNIKKGFVAAGFYMKYIRDNKFYIEAGYESIWEFADTVYGISKSTASRWMSINDKFSKDGNSPFLEEQFEQFEKSQLQEMLYLNDKQLEQVTPDMTVKEIKEVRKPKVVEEEVSILGYPLRVYPEGSLIATPGCGNQDCFSCHRDGCNLRQEECHCVEASCGNPFPCTTLNVVESIRGDIGKKCQFVNEDLAYHRGGDGQPVPCCKKCNNPCGYECNRSVKERYQTKTSEEEDVCDVAQKKCLHRPEFFCTLTEAQKVVTGDGTDCNEKCCWNCEKRKLCGYACNASKENHSVNTESEPVATSQQEKNPGQMDVYDYPELIPEEMQQEIIEAEYKEVEEKPKRATTILTYLVEAALEEYDIEENLLDVAEEDKNDSLQDDLFGETVTFTFCNTEMLGEFLSEIEIYNRGTLFKSYSWQQFFEEFEYVTSVKERTNQESVLEEEEQEEDVWTDLQLLQKMVNEENKLLNDILGCYSEKDVLTRKQKIKATALAALLCDWDTIEPEPPEPPELPQLKNNDQRKKFLETYETWPIWFEVPQASEVYHRFDLPDGSSIVVCEYHHYCEWKKRYGENPETTYHKEYLLRPGYKYLHDCEANQTALVEHLKNLQKGEK